jgi:hypothetical protein
MLQDAGALCLKHVGSVYITTVVCQAAGCTWSTIAPSCPSNMSHCLRAGNSSSACTQSPHTIRLLAFFMEPQGGRRRVWHSLGPRRHLGYQGLRWPATDLATFTQEVRVHHIPKFWMEAQQAEVVHAAVGVRVQWSQAPTPWKTIPRRWRTSWHFDVHVCSHSK